MPTRFEQRQRTVTEATSQYTIAYTLGVHARILARYTSTHRGSVPTNVPASMGEASGSAFVLRACIFLLLLIVSLVQLAFFTLLPDVSIHAEWCNATLAARSPAGRAPTSPELAPPLRLLYQSLYLSPREIARREKEAERLDAARKLVGDVLKRQATDSPKEETENEDEIPPGFFLQTQGQGHEPLSSAAAYCINLVAPGGSAAAMQDLELYLGALPSARPVVIGPGPTEPVELPTSVINIFLQRHPSNTQYFGSALKHQPAEKAVWMLQNAELFDRHELSSPPVGVVMVKNRVALQKVLEYRHRHQLSYSALYTKHTGHDVFQPSIQRDWTSFLHVPGASPAKTTKVIVQAWAAHPEWPKLVLRVAQPELCHWISRHFGSATSWRLANVDFQCGRLAEADKAALQNQIGLHVCPSEGEAFSHVLNEARSAGALILTTDVAPMNELVDRESGVLVGQPTTWWWQTKGDLFMPLGRVDMAAIEQGVEQILLLPVEERRRMGRRARAHYLEDRAFFLNAMAALEQAICQDEIRIDKLQPYLY